MNTIKNFFKGLFNESGEISSKRVAGILCIVCCAIAFMANLFLHLAVDHDLFNSFLLFAATCFSLNTFLQNKSIGAKKDVASDMVNNTSDNASATNVLQSDKPSA